MGRRARPGWRQERPSPVWASLCFPTVCLQEPALAKSESAGGNGTDPVSASGALATVIIVETRTHSILYNTSQSERKQTVLAQNLQPVSNKELSVEKRARHAIRLVEITLGSSFSSTSWALGPHRRHASGCPRMLN